MIVSTGGLFVIPAPEAEGGGEVESGVRACVEFVGLGLFLDGPAARIIALHRGHDDQGVG